jgi:hypothetical protein
MVNIAFGYVVVVVQGHDGSMFTFAADEKSPSIGVNPSDVASAGRVVFVPAAIFAVWRKVVIAMMLMKNFMVLCCLERDALIGEPP